LKLALTICGQPTHVEVSESDHGEALSSYFAPALSSGVELPVAALRVTSGGIEVLRGPRLSERPDMSAMVYLEWMIIGWSLALQEAASALHLGCVLIGRRPILFCAPSGGGKSTLTREALLRGATYVTDDLLVVRAGRLTGLARSIRFKDVAESEIPKSTFLKEMDVTSYRVVVMGEERIVPLWWGGGSVCHDFSLTDYDAPVVVRVSRGGDEVRRLSTLERSVCLHECAISSHGEYDGFLGAGPTYDLSWTNPSKTYELLLDHLRKDGVL